MRHPQHILIVDDQLEICIMLKHLLEKHGYRTSYTEGGAEMRGILEQEKVDLVLLDAVLPREPGIALAALATAKGVPVIMMSGALDALEQLDELPYLCIRKPFRIDDIVDIVKRALREPGLALSRGESDRGKEG